MLARRSETTQVTGEEPRTDGTLGRRGRERGRAEGVGSGVWSVIGGGV